MAGYRYRDFAIALGGYSAGFLCGHLLPESTMIWAWCIVQILLGWYLADFMSGVYHLILDRFGGPQTPIWGKQIYYFRIHHLRPTSVLGSPWYKDATIPAVIASLPLFALTPFAPWVFIPLGLGIAVNHETHKAAHRGKNWKVIEWLQRIQISLPPLSHLKHHRDFTQHYGVVNGWGDGLLNLLIRFLPLPAPKAL